MIQRLFLSVGAMKAGTTWLHEKLLQHPDIFFSPHKEVHFFAHYYKRSHILDKPKRDARARKSLAKLNAINPSRASKGDIERWYSIYTEEIVDYNWFSRLMEDGLGPNQYASDFSNLNCFLEPDDWMDIRENIPSLKVIYILRDPFARLWSHFKFHLKFISHKSAKMPDQDFKLFKLIINKPWFIRNCHYSECIKNLTMSLCSSEFRIFFFEDMVSDPVNFLREIEGFLQIQHFIYNGDLNKKTNKSIEVPCPTPWRNYSSKVLDNEVTTLREMGIWHPKWSDYCH